MEALFLVFGVLGPRIVEERRTRNLHAVDREFGSGRLPTVEKSACRGLSWGCIVCVVVCSCRGRFPSFVARAPGMRCRQGHVFPLRRSSGCRAAVLGAGPECLAELS